MTLASHILFRLVTTLVVLMGVVATVAACTSMIHAQQQPDDPPAFLADLSIDSEPVWIVQEQYWRITVRNNPVGDARPKFSVVKVRVVINDGIGAPVTEVHTLRDLPAGRSAGLNVLFPTIAPGVCGSSPVLSRIHAKIIETAPLESPALRFNNATENVGMACPARKFTNGDAGVKEVSVSDRSPQPGGATTFTVTARNDAGPPVHFGADQNNVQFDVQVKIGLSQGLTLAGTQPNPPSVTMFDPATRTWDVGIVQPNVEKSLPVAVSLTTDSLAEIPLEKRCLTADVSSAKPWFAWDGSKRENDAYTACLGTPPKVLLPRGKTTLFDFYPCVDVAAYPCTSANTLELVASRESASGHIIPGSLIAQPDEILIHISDPEGRTQDTNSKPIWPTSGIFDLKDSQERLPDSVWSAAREDLTVTGPDGGQPPGSFTMRFDPGVELPPIEITDTTKVTGDSFDPGYDVDIFLDFGSLGTYVLTMDIRATHSTAGTLTSSGTYTFHVGPLADMELRHAGTSPAVPAGRRGYTVMALNNGPEVAPDVQVTLNGVPEGAEAVPSHGNYTQGTCQDGICEGVWAIGELGLGDYRASGHANEGPALTLITEVAMPADITAAIANTQPYTVCIGSDGADVALTTPSRTACTNEDATNSWHSAAYYDHIERNNTATIAAHAGSGDGRPDAPEGVKVTETPVANIFVWQPVKTVNGHEVAHYEVQRSASPWMTLDSDVKGTAYVDMTPASDGPEYRVRAVNIFGVPGAWSEAATPHLKPGRPKSLTATGQSDTVAGLSWGAPDPVDGVTITGYDLEFSKDGGATWTSLAAPATLGPGATSYTHTDATLTAASLTPEVLRQYRLRTVGTVEGSTVKSDWATATLTHPKPGVPKSFGATGESATQATLSWSAPDTEAHVTVTGYELDLSTDGGVTWNWLPAGQTRTVLSATTLTHPHTDNTLGADAVRQYRLKAVGTVGSVAVQSGYAYALATENYPSPGAPRDFAATAASDTEVTLTWNAPEAVADVTLAGYELEVSIDRGVTWTPLADQSTLGPGATSHPHTDAANPLSSKPRQYRLKAVGTVGGSEYESGWVFAVPAGEVGPPRNLTATADGRNRIGLTWGEPAFGADLVTGYRIDYTPAATEDWRTLRHNYRTMPRSDQHTGLLPGDRYCYRVAAVYAGGTGPFAARACATTEGAPEELPGEPENPRVARVGSNYVTLEWDPPSVGGAVEYYEWRSNIHNPVKVSPRTATSVTVRGLPRSQTYGFQVRAGNSYGPGGWSRSVPVALHRLGSAVKATPDELEVEKGGSGSFNLSLSQAPRWPLMVYFTWEGPDCLTESLLYQQGKILLPNHPPPSKEFWEDFWWGPPEDRWARPWREGLDILVDAKGCQGGETAVVDYDLSTVPFSNLEGLSLWEVLDLNEAEWRDKWGVDPLEGISGPSVKLTVADSGPTGNVGGQQSAPAVPGQPTAVTLALSQARVSESGGEVTVTATLDAPAPEGGMGGFLFAGEDGTASADIDFTMPFEIFIPGGQRSGTATISITGDDVDEADETVALSALFDMGTALLEDTITLTITDDDTAGVTVSAASGLAVEEDGTASYTVVLDSRPTADVTIAASSGDAGAAAVFPESRTFQPPGWNIPLTFTVSGVGDTDTDDERVSISHGVTSGDAKYAAAAPATVPVAVTDTTPPNQPPTVSSAIADATIVNESGTHRASLSGVFRDADRDALTVTAASSNTAVATVSVSAGYSSLTVSAKARGTATITVTADDGNGGTVQDAFTVTVKAAPTVTSAIGDVSGLEAGSTRDVSLSGVFRDGDNDALTITAASSDETKATVSVAPDGSRLTLAGVAQGTASITVTAEDSDGNRVSDEFDVSVAAPQQQGTLNQAPTVANAVADATIVSESGTHRASLSGVFSDADRDALTITAGSSNTAVATVSVAANYSSLTVTAKDGSGGTVQDAFTVTVKAAPVVESAIGDLSLEEGGTQDISLSGVFSDADGDALTFTASSSDLDVANPLELHGTLTIIGALAGSATVTVTAEDSDGNAVSDTFDVTVTAPQQQDPANQAPTVANAIADVTIVNESGTKDVALSGVFSDADSNSLTITASSSAEAVATVSVASGYSSLTVTAKARGTATITVTADDGNGGTVDDAFTVKVKAAPVVAAAISDVSGLVAGDTKDVSLSGVFSDADGDALTITAASSDETKATVSVAAGGSKLTLSGVADGTATITVTAEDTDGNTVSDEFDVSVVGPPSPVENLRCVAEPERVIFLWDAPEWSGGETYAYDYELTLPDGRIEAGRFIGLTLLRRPGEYQVGTEASISVKAVYLLADESEVYSEAAALTCTVAG